MASFVPVARRAPGVHAESGRPPCATHPEVLVCTPQCGSAPVVLLPAVGVVFGRFIVTAPQPLNAIVTIASKTSKQTYFFNIPLLLYLKSLNYCKKRPSLGLQYKPGRIKTPRL